MVKKVLITGGLGNVGSWITGHLVKSGFDVTTFSSRDRNVLREYEFTRVFGRIENESDVKRLFSGESWDAVIHLASINEGNIPDYAKKALMINAFGTRNLLQSIADSGQANTHLIYFSTFHVYGSAAGFIEEDRTTPKPQNDYAATHLFAEYYVRQFHNAFHIPFTIFRLTNGYGCPKDRETSKWHLVLNDLAKTAIEKNFIELKTNGKPRRDFIWLGDVCRAVEKSLLKPPANQTFNLGGGATFSMLDLAETVKKAFQAKYGRTIEIKINEADETTYDPTLKVSIEKLQNHIDFHPHDKLYEEALAIFDFLESA